MAHYAFFCYLERATGFEPVTASLEGWNSTTELRPLSPSHMNIIYRLTRNSMQRKEV